MEGQLIPVIEERYPKDMVNLRHHLELYDPTPFDGEKIEDMLKRINDLVEKAVAEAQEGPLLFVGHGAALTATIQALTGKSMSELREMGGLFNNSLTILEAENAKPPYQMIQWNDVSFFRRDRLETRFVAIEGRKEAQMSEEQLYIVGTLKAIFFQILVIFIRFY